MSSKFGVPTSTTASLSAALNNLTIEQSKTSAKTTSAKTKRPDTGVDKKPTKKRKKTTSERKRDPSPVLPWQ